MIMTDLCRIARKHGTDKLRHGYTAHYDRWFADLRHQPVTLLEIGVYQGASIRTWREYFPHGEVYAVDVVQERLEIFAADSRVRTACLHQGKQQQWQEFLQSIPDVRFDIVIDDGSHAPRDQWVSWEALFPRLSDNGLYIVEDLQPHSAFVARRHPFVDALATLINARLYSQEFLDVRFVGHMAAIRKGAEDEAFHRD